MDFVLRVFIYFLVLAPFNLHLLFLIILHHSRWIIEWLGICLLKVILKFYIFVEMSCWIINLWVLLNFIVSLWSEIFTGDVCFLIQNGKKAILLLNTFIFIFRTKNRFLYVIFNSILRIIFGIFSYFDITTTTLLEIFHHIFFTLFIIIIFQKK